MRRGDIYLVDLEPAREGEADKRRPAVIVSNDAGNAVSARFGRGVVTIVPLTPDVSRIYPFQVLLPAGRTGLRSDSKAQAEQVRSLSAERLGVRVGLVPLALMRKVDDALRVHLDLI